MPKPIIEVKDLKVDFPLRVGSIEALKGVSFSLLERECTCIVGESGSGKSVTAKAIMRLLAQTAKIRDGSILYTDRDGAVTDLAKLPPSGAAMRSIRGRDIAMVFQEPMSSLSPVHKIGDQIMESVLLHLKLTKAQAREHTLAIMDRVGIPNPRQRFDNYPFQMSGGLRQRVVIALALACNPRLIIADEPTTALDVTTQANILDLLLELQQEMGMSIMFITHDLGVVAEIAHKVVVMYTGTVVETGDVDTIFHNPRHPYTKALLGSMPRLAADRSKPLAAIRGMVPHPLNRPKGCLFHPRCDVFVPGLCDKDDPGTVEMATGQRVKCVRALESTVSEEAGNA